MFLSFSSIREDNVDVLLFSKSIFALFFSILSFAVLIDVCNSLIDDDVDFFNMYTERINAEREKMHALTNTLNAKK